MPRQRVRLITYAWGRQYADRLLDLALAAALAPGNLPALAKRFDCTVVIVTEESLFDYVRTHPLAKRLEAVCPLSLVSLDDLVGEPWQYGLTVAYSLFRGFVDLGPQMTDTYLLFLNADFIMADGCYERLIPHIVAGDRVMLSPSYCVLEERVRPILTRWREPETGMLALPPREMAQIIIDHRHNTIRAKTVNQRLIHYQYMDQFYWQVDDHTLLGHQMPIAMVGMRPERALTDINTFWDWGVVYEFCPSKNVTVLGDSDEFLMLEMRAEKTYLDLVRLGWSSPREIASRMTGYITYYQVDNARFPLTLHSRELPPDVEAARAALRAVKDEILRHLPSAPIDHRNHAQWIYHKGHFEQYRQAQRSEITRVRHELAQLEDEFRREHALLTTRHESLVEALKGRYEPKLDAVRRTLAELESAPKSIADPAATPPASGVGLPALPRLATFARRAYKRVFGAFPYPRPWHPLHSPYRRVAMALNHPEFALRTRILAVCSPQTPLARMIAALPGEHAHLSPTELPRNNVASVAGHMAGFDVCIMALRLGEIGQAAGLFRAVLPRMKPEATVLIHGSNLELLPRASWERELVSLLLRVPRPAVYYAGSWSGVAAVSLMNRAYRTIQRHSRLARVFGMAMAAAMGTVIVPLAISAALRERRSMAPTSAIPAQCTAVTVEIALQPGSTP